MMQDNEMRRLMSRWVFDMALLLKDEWPEMTRSEALRQAHLAVRLLKKLGSGTVRFTYRKRDGQIREAVGTLCKGISPAFDSYDRKTETEDDGHLKLNINYWDLERETFRSFCVQNLINVNDHEQ